jgi:hypothetical protein
LTALLANLNTVVEQISGQPAAHVDAHMFTSVPHSGTGCAACFLAQVGRSKMMEMVIGTIIMLIAAAIAIFLILIAINVVLFLKLRSIIPQSSPQGHRPHATARLAARTPGDNYPKPARRSTPGGL